MNILSSSILAADFWKLGEDIACVERTGCRYLHIDVMDGVFVPAISFGMPVIKSIRRRTDLFFDEDMKKEAKNETKIFQTSSFSLFCTISTSNSIKSARNLL